ncbi:MAG: NADP-dependent methylenetetrahydromethanopterin/methylenetetrahydrofolate dehydrogenase [Gemmatimonadales bacterium]
MRLRKVLVQLDSSRLPSVFDRVVAVDAGADEVLSYGGVAEADVRDLIHGCIFTRGPKDLKNTAVFIGGADMTAGEQLLAAARRAFFGPFTVSLMLDSNGSNTTAVAAVAKMVQAAGDVRGKRVLIVAGTGPVGIRAAGLFAKAGAEVIITSRQAEAGERARDLVVKRFGGTVRTVTMANAGEAVGACQDAELVLNAGPAGVMLVPKQAWANRPGLKVIADVNAVPPLGVEGVDPMDDGVVKEGVICFGALAIGNLKMKVHKACIVRLFERNDLVLDAETIADVARELIARKS